MLASKQTDQLLASCKGIQAPNRYINLFAGELKIVMLGIYIPENPQEICFGNPLDDFEKSVITIWGRLFC